MWCPCGRILQRRLPFDWHSFEVNVFRHQCAHPEAGKRGLRETIARLSASASANA
jgi:hypothetical protein